MGYDELKSLIDQVSAAPRERVTKIAEPRSLVECFVKGYDPGIKENDWRMSWQHPSLEKMVRPIVGPTEIGSVKGGSGNGKSSSLRAMFAAVYEEEIRKRGLDPTDLTLGFKFKPPEGEYSVAWIDTEQSQSLFYKRMRQMYGDVLGDKSRRPANFWPFFLKGIPMKWKIKYIEDFCEAMIKQGTPLTLIFLDHIGDFVDNYNDERQAIDLFAELDELATKYDFSIIYVIHTNSTSSKQNGHVGSQGNRKNVSELYICPDENDGRITWIIPEKLRDGPKDFKVSFRRNSKGGYKRDNIEIINYEKDNDDALQIVPLPPIDAATFRERVVDMSTMNDYPFS